MMVALAIVVVLVAIFVWWDVFAQRRKLRAYAEALRASRPRKK